MLFGLIKTTQRMFRGVYDYLSGARQHQVTKPIYTITRMFGTPPLSGGSGATKHLYTISRADDYIHFKAAVLVDLMGRPQTASQVERILRDFLRYTMVRERYVVLRVGDWWGEFTVAGNPPGNGTVMLESNAA